MTLIKTTSRTYCLSHEHGVTKLIMGYNVLGVVICMTEPKVGARLKVKYTASGNLGNDDWEVLISAPIVDITVSEDLR